MNYTEQLERETERTRVELANTVEELRERLTPGEVLDEVLDYASDGEVGDFLRNFRRQVIDNPLPLGLMGVSVAWLVAASAFGRRNGQRMRAAGTAAGDRLARRTDEFAADARETGRAFADRADDMRMRAAGQARDIADRATDRASDIAGRTVDRASDMADRASDMAGYAADGASDIARRATDRAGEMAGYAADRASEIAGRAADQAGTIAGQASDRMANVAEQANAAAARVGERMRGAASAAGANLAAAGDNLTDGVRSSARAMGDAATGIAKSSRGASRALLDFGREQPLIVAATGLVLGAIIGALLPSTQLEDELVGETSDAAKERLREMAGEQYEKAKDVAVRTTEAALEASGISESSSHDHASGATDASSHEHEGAGVQEAHEFGPGPGVHNESEQASGGQSNATEEAERTHAGGP
ncbi:MAG TPA: DUF3618 domain-containing protein [Stellaceae bacterium]|nr:DUF3618 domain-containing protein [Stellaceae bacterium]